MTRIEPNYLNEPPELPKNRKTRHIAGMCVCAICKRGDKTLLKRNGAYICQPCYRELLARQKQTMGG